MAINWPASLPGTLDGSLSIKKKDPWVSDPSEVGAARRRNRFTRSLHRFTFMLRLTDAEMTTLDTFYETTLLDGAQSFNWSNPKDGNTVTVRFEHRYEETSLTNDIWDVPISLEEV